jgi:hypothetical protein
MNKLKARLKSGEACINAWLAIPSGFSAEMMAQCGFDGVTVDSACRHRDCVAPNIAVRLSLPTENSTPRSRWSGPMARSTELESYAELAEVCLWEADRILDREVEQSLRTFKIDSDECPSANLMSAEALNDELQRALAVLERHDDGCPEAELLAEGFSVEQLSGLTIDGLTKIEV